MAKSARRSRDDDAEDEEAPPRRRRRDDDDDEPPRRKRPRKDNIPPGTPRIYIHRKCGKRTAMPAEVIEAYLDNPFAFGHQTDCSHCDKVVPWKNCEWLETKQNLLEYFEDLQARAILADNDQRENEEGRGMILIGPIVSVVILAPLCAYFGQKELGIPWFFGVLLGIVVGIVFGLYRWFIEKREYERIKESYDRQLFKKFYARHPDERPGRKGKRPRRDDDE